jgi:hypothetical protein
VPKSSVPFATAEVLAAARKAAAAVAAQAANGGITGSMLYTSRAAGRMVHISVKVRTGGLACALAVCGSCLPLAVCGSCLPLAVCGSCLPLAVCGSCLPLVHSDGDACAR